MGVVHIVGGGMAGLSAAVELAGTASVVVYEAGIACGGRARSYFDRKLGCRIDNGNHLLLSANEGVFRYLGLIGAEKTLTGPGSPIFPYFDLEADLAWTLRLSRGRVPFWALPGGARVPGMRLSELGALFALLQAGDDAVVADCLRPGQLARRLLEPFAVSVLNTTCAEGSARLLGNVVRRSLMQGGMACRPWFPAIGLSESLVDPALAHLSLMRADVRTRTRVSGLEVEHGSVQALLLGDERVAIGPEDRVILAVPPGVAESLLASHWADFTVPDAFESILNVHYRLPAPVDVRGVLAQTRLVGLVGGIAEWVFVKGDVLSVTVSAANRYLDRDMDTLGHSIWGEVRRAVGPTVAGGLPETAPAMRVVVEKRATFAATPAQERRRPALRTPFGNLVLAGDWTATGLPATLEGAIGSGVEAARAIL
ncbi:hydroxysqualene dehydroxylase HpnE [Tanticharoenia sakaeratensis]|uniref:Oxidoreductase n=1 Tax=Tanticharoenia sakaeratensis NBRC 103193 TaxID=1231623 RepID=A0A0D6MMS0_9PROT|nr:hydroxysqualene dehydroxylase HpnE [Tanticharoenia sakaeratensis]GAN54720.1 oxidoreductase [Tanticharoenia sakaeratensis NBRC 103193]GBQ16906.1 phytoene desaturase [Tanticharoenia sakaeratensis NBRC 103193]